MRFLLLLLLFVCAQAFGQNTLSHGTSTLFQGSTNRGTFATHAACVAAAEARTITTTTAYQCRENLTVMPPAPPPPQPTVTLAANPATVIEGSASTLQWSSAGTTGCIASGGWSGARAVSGSESTGPLSVATAYTLTCNGAGGSASASVTVNTQAAPPPGSQFGLEWPGTGQVRRMLYWSNPMPMYDATYIFRVFPKGPKNNGSGGNYWTTFFWGNNGAFIWEPTAGQACGSFYGAHPYPFGGNGSTSGQNWELSTNCNDYSFVTPNGSNQVQWNRWFTQAFRAYRDVPNNRYCHDFYFDLPDTSKVINWCTWSNYPFNFVPPSPAIMMGQTANVNGLSWGGYPGWEEFKGIIRGLQFYSASLSVADVLNEVTTPQSTAAGNASAWYVNLNPRPSDVTDKKAGGTPHNPQWDGTTAIEWAQ